jgi:hypothetical protein
MSVIAAVCLIVVNGMARYGLGSVAMTIGALPRHAKLALDRAARGLVLRVERHLLGIFFGDGCQRLVAIELGCGSTSTFRTMRFKYCQRRATSASFRTMSAA